MKKNYQAWQITSKKFKNNLSEEEKLKCFAKYAILAPSGHNTQPWKIHIKQNKLSVSINYEHYLSIDGSGLKSVEPLVSIGSFLETLNQAAAGFGHKLDISYKNKNSLIAEAMIKSTKTTPDKTILEAIVHRVSNRFPFSTDKIPASVIQTISSSTFNLVKPTVITKRSDIEYIARLTERATTSIMSKPEYRNELSNWVRTNQTNKYDGMPGFTHGFGNTQSLISKFAVKHAPGQGPQANKSRKLIENSAALVVVSCTTDSSMAFLNLGRLFAYIFILATRNNLAASALGAAAQDPTTREELKDYFKISGRPVYILRIGKPKQQAKHSPRWPLEAVLEKET